MTIHLAKIIQEITEDIIRAARQVMSSDVGINEKVVNLNPKLYNGSNVVGKNTLHGSNLYKQISTSWKETGDNIVVDTLFNHYIGYIEWDRPPKYGDPPPVIEIIKWLRRKHIVSSNENIKSVAYVISRSIWKKGHKGRKIFDMLDKYVDSGFENKYADMIFDALFKEVDDYFGV